MVIDNNQQPAQRIETYEALDKALRNVQHNLDATQPANAPVPPTHTASQSSLLKRHHSLPGQQQSRSVDNLRGMGPVSSRTRRGQGVPQYETPEEEDELLDEVLSSTQKAMKRVDRTSIHNDSRQPLRQSASNMAISNPYPTPSPSASGHAVLFGHEAHVTPSKVPQGSTKQSATPPYDYMENEWASSASASIFAVQNRF
jgi:meiosis induction protein kinase IME2/SME1